MLWSGTCDDPNRNTEMFKNTISAIALSVLCAGLAMAQTQTPTDKVITAIMRWSYADAECRGGPGDAQQSCNERDELGKRLHALGWCYEYRGAATNRPWHPCDR
jgi:hypothetical protein